MFKNHLPYLLFFLLPLGLLAQQVPDSSFTYPIAKPRYAQGTGPIVCIDAAHQNFHTPDNRFYAFARLLQADGYQVKAFTDNFTPQSLSQCQILVISNPLNSVNAGGNWRLPTPSAFTAEEIQAVKTWVSHGGKLFLIADHMPFAGAAADLGKAFGFEFLNSFAMDNRQRSVERFYKNKTLQVHPITSGIDTVVTFTGSAFKIPATAKPVLRLDHTYTVLMPQVAWQFEEDTPFVPGTGLCQLAALDFGKGRVFVSGEAAMFTAQLGGPNRDECIHCPAESAVVIECIALAGWEVNAYSSSDAVISFWLCCHCSMIDSIFSMST